MILMVNGLCLLGNLLQQIVSIKYFWPDGPVLKTVVIYMYLIPQRKAPC